MKISFFKKIFKVLMRLWTIYKIKWNKIKCLLSIFSSKSWKNLSRVSVEHTRTKFRMIHNNSFFDFWMSNSLSAITKHVTCLNFSLFLCLIHLWIIIFKIHCSIKWTVLVQFFIGNNVLSKNHHINGLFNLFLTSKTRHQAIFCQP